MRKPPIMAAALSCHRGLLRPRQLSWLTWLAALACVAISGPSSGQIQSLSAPPPGFVEAGVPQFAILSPEAIGLTGTVVDLKRLPDGRLVVASRRELAFGDGARWDVFPEVPGSRHPDIESVMLDDAGALFVTTGNGVARVVFNEQGRWSRQPEKQFPPTDGMPAPYLMFAARVADDWYWYGESGCITRWDHGPDLRYLGAVNTISRLFEHDGRVYVSDHANGRLYQLDGTGLRPVAIAAQDSPNLAVTGSAPFDEHRTLVTTLNAGLWLFDGTTFTAPPRAALLQGGRQITALCALPGGTFVAAVESIGLVFFDRSGRILQTLGRNSDHRFAHVRQLVPGAPGELWAILRHGLARIATPSPFSHLEALVESGFSFALPVRHRGHLWLCADGVAQRGEYDDDGRLVRFVVDNPPGRYLYQLFPDPEGDTLVATTDGGISLHRGERWEPGPPAPTGLHIIPRCYGGSRWFYCAPGQIGWFSRDGSTYRLDSVPSPQLADTFGGLVDADDVAWLELGAGRVGRVDLRQPTLQLHIFDRSRGLPESWAQLFLYRDQVRLAIAGTVMRFDAAAQRFVLDEEFARRFPPLIPGIDGRPIIDPANRLWAVANAALHVFDDQATTATSSTIPELYGLRPSYTIPQEDGVLWFHRGNYLIRYDPAIPFNQRTPLRALITRIRLPADSRTLLPQAGRIPDIGAASNTLSFHYSAPGAPLGSTVVFETRLGATSAWEEAGPTGVTTFNRLKEGDYRFQVRPRIGDLVGEEAVLTFTVLPPWYRSTAAYAAYAVAALSLAAFIAWLGAFLEKREKRRLALLVAARTAELHDSNRRLVAQVHETTRKATELQASEERFRHLNEELEKRVADRTAALAASNRELEAFSYSVSHDLRAPLRNISGFAELLHKQLHAQVAPAQAHYLDLVSGESVRLGQLIDCLLTFSRLGRAELQHTPCELAHLVAAVRDELASTCANRDIEWRIGPLPTVPGDATLLRQVFANLVGNAVKFTRQRSPAVIEIGAQPATPDASEHILFVRDNGAGFDPQYSDKLFGVFQRLHRVSEFEGTGIGLANVRRIITRHGGRVWAEGKPGEGATFYFSLPANPPHE